MLLIPLLPWVLQTAQADRSKSESWERLTTFVNNFPQCGAVFMQVYIHLSARDHLLSLRNYETPNSPGMSTGQNCSYFTPKVQRRWQAIVSFMIMLKRVFHIAIALLIFWLLMLHLPSHNMQILNVSSVYQKNFFWKFTVTRSVNLRCEAVSMRLHTLELKVD